MTRLLPLYDLNLVRVNLVLKYIVYRELVGDIRAETLSRLLLVTDSTLRVPQVQVTTSSRIFVNHFMVQNQGNVPVYRRT